MAVQRPAAGKIRRWCKGRQSRWRNLLFNGGAEYSQAGANLIASPFIRPIDIFPEVKAGLALGRRQSRAVGSEIVLATVRKSLTMLLGNGLIKAGYGYRPDIYLAGSALLMNPCRPDYHRYRRRRLFTCIATRETDFRFSFAGVWERIKTAFEVLLASRV